MKPKERFLRRLKGQDVDKVPAGCTTAYGVVDLMKRCGCERPLADVDPACMAGLSMAGHTIAGFDWVKAMGWDITAVSEALGCTLGEPAIDSQYYIASHPFAQSIENLECPRDLLSRGRFPAYREQFRLLKEKVGNDLVIFGMSEGPFTCAANLVGTDRMMRATIKEPTFVEKALDVTAEALIQVIRFAFSNGADYFCMADPTSGGDLLSPKSWERIVSPVIRRIVNAVDGPIVLHICGNIDKIIPSMCETGIVGISLEEKTDLKAAIETARARGVRVFGNVAAASTLFMGTEEDCYREAMAALESGVDFLAPGCGIAPNSPLENVLQLRRARDDFHQDKQAGRPESS
ncbi:MAG: MtaA/CmuA family methyltransferase [Syntrophobacteraceae bacterium]|nr:MtaA/CmuA family methyltransferase [Syntrophobacteraceae bacterium]